MPEEKPKKSKRLYILLGVLGLVVVIFIATRFLGGGDNNRSSAPLASSSNTTSTGDSVAPDTEGPGADLVTILNSLSRITLDDSLFVKPAFAALQDITIPINREGNEGRPNPFAPIGIDPVLTPPTDAEFLAPTDKVDNDVTDDVVTPPTGAGN